MELATGLSQRRLDPEIFIFVNFDSENLNQSQLKQLKIQHLLNKGLFCGKRASNKFGDRSGKVMIGSEQDGLN